MARKGGDRRAEVRGVGAAVTMRASGRTLAGTQRTADWCLCLFVNCVPSSRNACLGVRKLRGVIGAVMRLFHAPVERPHLCNTLDCFWFMTGKLRRESPLAQPVLRPSWALRWRTPLRAVACFAAAVSSRAWGRTLTIFSGGPSSMCERNEPRFADHVGSRHVRALC